MDPSLVIHDTFGEVLSLECTNPKLRKEIVLIFRATNKSVTRLQYLECMISKEAQMKSLLIRDFLGKKKIFCPLQGSLVGRPSLVNRRNLLDPSMLQFHKE